MAKNKSIWTTRDGTNIRVCDMTNSHLLNTIKMLERNKESYINQAINSGLAMSCMVTGEMALYSIENSLNFLESGEADIEDIFPIYADLINERDKRGFNV